jgi:Stage II sporulation protein E (SpoIIE)/GAF domain
MDQSRASRRTTSPGKTRAPRAATSSTKRHVKGTATSTPETVPPAIHPSTSPAISPAVHPSPGGTGANDPLPRMFAEIGEDLAILTGEPIQLAALHGAPPEEALSAEVLEFARPIARLVAPAHTDPARLEAAAQVLGTLAEREAALASLAAHAAQLWREMRFFLAAELELAAPLPLAEAAPALLAAALDTVGAHRGSIYVAEPPRLKPIAGRGIDAMHLQPIVIEDPESIAAWVFRQGAPLVVNDPKRRPKALKSHHLKLPPDVHDGFLALPLLLPNADRTPVGVMNLAGRTGGAFSEDDVKVAVAMAQMVAIALHRARITGESLAASRLRGELRVAAEIHAERTTPLIPAWPNLEIAAASTSPSPAAGTSLDAGDPHLVRMHAPSPTEAQPHRSDTCDFVTAEDALHVVIAGIDGHGIEAALTAQSVRSVLRTALWMGSSPGAALECLNRVLAEQTGKSGLSATATIARISGDRITFAAAGRSPLLLAPASGEAAIVRVSGPPAGASPDAEYEEQERRLGPGDVIALTSGTWPGANASERESRLLRALARHAQAPAAEILVELLDQVGSAGPLAAALPGDSADEHALVVLKRPATGASAPVERARRAHDSLPPPRPGDPR